MGLDWNSLPQLKSDLSLHPGEKPSMYANMYNLCSVDSSEHHEGVLASQFSTRPWLCLELRLCVMKRRAKDVMRVRG